MNRIDHALAEGRHPLSLAHLTMIDCDHATLVRAAAAGGFDAVGLRLLPPRHTRMAATIIDNPALIAETKGALADTGVGVMDVESFTLHPETRISDFAEGLSLAAELGARWVLTSSTDPDAGRVLDNFCGLCAAGAAHGLGVGMEFISYRHIRTLADAIELLRAASQPNGGIIIDTLHLHRTGGSPADVAALDPRMIAYIQIADAAAEAPVGDEALIREARSGRLLPGDGGLRLGELLAAFAPTLPLGVEAPGEGLARLEPIARGRLIGERVRDFLARQGLAVPQWGAA
jgi:sugar phosphate isomerase/epimerase